MTEGNKLEQEAGNQVSTKDKVLQFLPGTMYFSSGWWDRATHYMQATNIVSTTLAGMVGFLGLFSFAANSIEYGTMDRSKWDEARQQQLEQKYQEHKDEAMKTLDKYDLNDDKTLGPEEFNRFYQEIRNSRYGEWKSMQDSYKSGEE